MESDSNYEPEPEEIANAETNKKPHKCEYPGCTAAFSRPSRLEQHLMRPYKCKQEGCDKAYTNPSHLKRHAQSHSEIAKTYTCCVCSVKISTLSNLKRHYNRAHNTERELHCMECNVYFRKKNRYEEHMAAHKHESMYKCGICEKEYLSHTKLKKHEEIHNKIYECPIENCSKTFTKWALMIKHKRKEHINKYPCPECGKEFLTKACLRLHAEVHSEDRPAIPCPYEKCTRLYYFKRNLDQHIRRKHNGQKFICDICNRCLSTKQKLQNHIIAQHLSEKKPFKRKAPAPRKDTGQAKRSALSELTGLHLSVKAEVQLMKRNPTALLRDAMVEESVSEDDRVSDTSAKGA
ncbi:hypothetical protein TSAR_007722 [Trichomalopsis sarcophagae]|uniref:C2H2-type domain-containing protein n=1 Tax=Trichomalopsis sarcophagae TaxID=543379 RepID=A0A232EKY1_9HYME|nr:hypothetical protein TSAR_007722 [Trichomalopsis sarcophagae]